MSRFQRLYRENFPFVWAAAFRCGAPSHAVDDVVQDVFVTAYRRIDELYYEASPRGWLYGVTRRIAFRYRRSAARSVRRHVAYGQAARTSSEPHAQHDAARDLEALLQHVDEAQRETFVMSELLGMSGPEIAGELCVPVDTVYSRLRLARRRLSTLAGSSERLRAGVVHACEAQAPASKQQARTWAAIVPAIGAKAIALPLVSLGTVKAATLPVVFAAAAAIAFVLHTEDTTDVWASASQPAVHARDAEQQAAPPPKPAADTFPPIPPPAAVPVTDAPPPVIPSITPAVVAARPPTASRAAAASGATQDLAQELAILDRAGAAVRRGELRRALDVLAEHARRFPKGQLEEARRATRVQVLCDLGRSDAARAEGAALRREHPGSAVAARTAKICDRS